MCTLRNKIIGLTVISALAWICLFSSTASAESTTEPVVETAVEAVAETTAVAEVETEIAVETKAEAVVEVETVSEAGEIAASDTKEVLTTLEQRMQKRISVDFRDAPIEDVIRIIADQANVDIIKSPNVIGSVTATLTNIPLEEVLDHILASHGYAYVTGKNMIRVAPANEISEKNEKLITSIYRINYADVVELEKALSKFLSSRGSLSSNIGTSNIIVTDTESKIRAIDTFVEEIDRITPQILVEVRIYDVTSKDRLDLGIEWQAGRTTDYGAGGITSIGPDPTGFVSPFATGLFNGTTGKTTGTTGGLRLGWLTGGTDVDVFLKAQQQDISAKLLANPSILVLDNEQAKINIISEIPFQEITETSGGGSIGSTEFREVGVQLEVRPHITRDEMIRMHLVPEFSVKVENVTVGVPGSTFEQPVVDRRKADTTLLIKHGQTVVLGGLRKKEVAKHINKIPLLGDIPILGWLFMSEGEDTVTSELVVFVTPWIVEEPTMNAVEEQRFQETEFAGPEATYTRAEKENDSAAD